LKGSSFAAEAYEDGLRVFAYRVIPDRSNIHAFGAKSRHELSQSIRTLNEFSLCESVIIPPRYGNAR
jgi:hypothetical protein